MHQLWDFTWQLTGQAFKPGFGRQFAKHRKKPALDQFAEFLPIVCGYRLVSVRQYRVVSNLQSVEQLAFVLGNEVSRRSVDPLQYDLPRLSQSDLVLTFLVWDRPRIGRKPLHRHVAGIDPKLGTQLPLRSPLQ